MLSGALDAHLDHYDSVTTGHMSRALHYLNIGRLPLSSSLCLLAGFFGLIGILLQTCLRYALAITTPDLFVILSVYCLQLLQCIIPVKCCAPDSTRP
ncbi:hypothetical protein ACNKHM_17105 [Shigella sonnei]